MIKVAEKDYNAIIERYNEQIIVLMQTLESNLIYHLIRPILTEDLEYKKEWIKINSNN